MKFLMLLNKMNKEEKIIVSISVVAMLLVISILVATKIVVNNSSDESVITKTMRVEDIKDLPEEIVEEAVALQDSDEVSEEQLEAEKVDPANTLTGSATYYIKVNYGANTVTVYGKDSEGKYTVPVKAMICSCGISTPKSGVYKTSKGYKWGTLIGGVYGQYSTRIVGNILFHSVPYTAQSPDSLEYWEFDKLGTKASAGCVRLMVSDAKWIFYNCEAGTMVEFYSDSNPGPLGKPSAPKISDNEMCRNWDPTDDAAGNPWASYFQSLNATNEANEQLPAQEEQQVQPQKPVQNTTNNNSNTSSNTISPVNNTTNTSNQNDDNTVVDNTIDENTNTTSGSGENPPGGNENTDPNEGNEGGDNAGNGNETGNQGNDEVVSNEV